ncbi:hypothetical protein GYB57_04760 [bacterium]|nr:hypothetical protein [bacterium]
MKKLIKGALFFALVGTVIVGCEQEESIKPISNNDHASQKVKVKNTQTDKSNDLQWEVTPEDLEDEVYNLTVDFSDDPDYEEATITITPIPQSSNYLFSLDIDGMAGNPNLPPTPEKIVCEGSGYSFAKCVGNWLDANPNGCLLICNDGNGGYTADDDNC